MTETTTQHHSQGFGSHSSSELGIRSHRSTWKDRSLHPDRQPEEHDGRC